jgi:hypothetical protein
MTPPADLVQLEAIIDNSAVAADLEACMPTGGRPRQLPVRTLLIGVLLALGDDRPAHLTRVHQALLALPEADQRRLRVIDTIAGGQHTLTYRQVERTFGSMVHAIDPTPVPSFRGLNDQGRAAHLAAARAGLDTESREARRAAFADAFVEASIPDGHKSASSSVAVDWTDHATWSRPVDGEGIAADPDAAWGHRRPNTPGTRHQPFFGYYGQAVAMVPDEGGPPVPELIRRVALHPCHLDPPTALVATLDRMATDGIVIGDVLADSGYAHRVAAHWASPLRRLGARLVQDLHPHDRGPRGTHQGALLCNGQLYCPATPAGLLQLGPASPAATAAELADHDRRTAELARYKLGRLSADDTDGYHRVGCPAAASKLRCPLKPTSMSLGFDHPEVLNPPTGEPPPCCAQASITVAPTINAKTRQKHDYPSQAHRRSYLRRTGVERCFSTLKDPATTDVRRGWCRLMGRAKNLVMLTLAVVVRNLRVLASFKRRTTEPPRTTGVRRRKRRRDQTLD